VQSPEFKSQYHYQKKEKKEPNIAYKALQMNRIIPSEKKITTKDKINKVK
jgi:hypothetical protein